MVPPARAPTERFGHSFASCIHISRICLNSCFFAGLAARCIRRSHSAARLNNSDCRPMTSPPCSVGDTSIRAYGFLILALWIIVPPIWVGVQAARQRRTIKWPKLTSHATKKAGMTRTGNLQAGTRSQRRPSGAFAPLLTENFSQQGRVTALTADEKERERIRAARIAAGLQSLRHTAAERGARVDRVLEQADEAAAKRKAETAESKAERVAKARRQAGQRLLLRALRLIPPDERDEAIAAALRQA